MQPGNLLWLVGSILSLVLGLLVGTVFAIAVWRWFARDVLGRDAGPTVPSFFLIGPGIATFGLLMLAYGLFREYMGWNVGLAPAPPASDCDDESLFAALGLLALCLWMTWRTFVRRRQVQSTVPAAVAGLAGGVVLVEGVAEALPGADALRSPLSGVPCLAVHATLTQPDSDGGDRTLVDHKSAAPFGVRDATGVVTVVPVGADYLIDPGLRWSREAGLSGSARWLAALAATGVDAADFPARLQRNVLRHRGGGVDAAAVPAGEAPADDPHRQALAYSAAMRAALLTPDLDTARLDEVLLQAGDPVAVLGQHDPRTGRIAAARGVELSLAPDGGAFHRRYVSLKPLLGWGAGALAALAWLWFAGGC